MQATERTLLVSPEDEAEEAWRLGLSLRIRAVMVIKELSNGDVGREIGVNGNRVSNWLNGVAVPQLYYLHLFSKAYGVSCDFLMNEDIEPLQPDLKKALLRGPRAAILSRRPDLQKLLDGE